MMRLSAFIWLALLLPLPACSIPQDKAGGEVPGQSQSQPEAPSKLRPQPQYGYQIRQGRSLYLHYCSPCHGISGQGDGFNAFNLDPRPRNLSDPAFQQKRSVQDLSEVVRRGGRGSGLSNGMPPWGQTLNDRQIGYIVRYLRTLQQEDAK